MSLFLRLLLFYFAFSSMQVFFLGPLNATPAFPRPASVSEGLGFNIHFLDPLPGEMEMLAASGIRWVRADFYWEWIEKEPGRYDFAAHDRFLEALKPYGIRPIFILCYGNPFYDQRKPPFTEEGRQAFARWVEASVQHFRGKGVVWEMWNEPNIGIFWPPKPNVENFNLLALKVGKTIRELAPEEILIGPALSKLTGKDLKFLEANFKAGLLEYWSAISVHPYRSKDPESVAPDYERLQSLIARYAPAGREIPFLVGEWGFSTQWRGIDETKQGKYLARQWLFNLMNHIPLSIWYDWRDDGLDPNNGEHHYGSVYHPHFPGRPLAFDPKPAYKAAKTLNESLKGFQFRKRLAVGGPDDYVLLFQKGEELRLVAWTRSKKTKKVSLPADPGPYSALGHTGEQRTSYLAISQGLCLPLSDAPQYLTPPPSTPLLKESAAWSPAYERQIRGRDLGCAPIEMKK